MRRLFLTLFALALTAAPAVACDPACAGPAFGNNFAFSRSASFYGGNFNHNFNANFGYAGSPTNSLFLGHAAFLAPRFGYAASPFVAPVPLVIDQRRGLFGRQSSVFVFP